MISEAMRFLNIRQSFSGRWEETTLITRDQADYVVHWGQLSTLLVRWKKSPGKWSGPIADAVKSIKVNGATDAWNLIDFLLRPLET
ncbi:hypothetical protein HU200_031802 [Digitaria exilis]|uniref:rRNA N-glycosidase n=1 Tax=Digitaria exilis TaxID=1010633 RepID=A0A835BUJ3_9POAL|nr:hypothetical protein HU200_031802 [Digitaria exilis]